MADPRLRYNAIAAPDVSQASAALARANQSFNSAFDGGQDILAKYGAAQQKRVDDEILSEIAALGDEAEFDAYIDGGNLAGRNVSDTMRSHILGLRSGLVNDDGTRARTAGTRAGTSISLARESRDSADYFDRIGRRDAERGAAGAINDAREYGLDNGDIVGDTITRQNGGNRQIAYRDGIAGIESAGSGDYNAVGPTDPELGRALGRYQIMEANIGPWSRAALGQEISVEEFMANPDLQDAIFDHRFGQYVEQYGEAGAAQAWFGGEGNIGNTNGTDSLGGVTIGEYGNRFVDSLGNTGLTTQEDTPVGAARRQLEESGFFTASEIDTMLSSVTAAEETNATNRAAADEAAQRERAAQAALALIQDPTNLSNTDVANDALSDPNFSAVDRINLSQQAQNLAEQNAGVLSPEVQEDARVSGISDQIIADLDNALSSDNSQARLVDSIDTFKEDPAGTLISQLEIATDEQTPSYFTPEQVNAHINKVADEYSVTREVAAAAMREIYIRDPGDDESSSFWYNSDLTRNTVGNRFPIADVGKIIEESLSQSAISGVRATRNQAGAVTNRVNTITNQITRLQQQAAKGGDRAAIGQEIADLMVELSSIRSQNSELFGTPSN